VPEPAEESCDVLELRGGDPRQSERVEHPVHAAAETEHEPPPVRRCIVVAKLAVTIGCGCCGSSHRSRPQSSR
jgi:hypothetical protein